MTTTEDGLPRRARARDDRGMKTYGQYCPIARASEVLSERWTVIILRNLLNGATTFTEIAEDAPGISSTLLSSRLRALQRIGLVDIAPKPNGHGCVYRLTDACRDLHQVLVTMGSGPSDGWISARGTSIRPPCPTRGSGTTWPPSTSPHTGSSSASIFPTNRAR